MLADYCTDRVGGKTTLVEKNKFDFGCVQYIVDFGYSNPIELTVDCGVRLGLLYTPLYKMKYIAISARLHGFI